MADKTVREQPSKVTFELTAMGSTVKLKLQHEDLIPADLVDREDTFEGINNGWPAILSNLKSLLETGGPCRPFRLNQLQSGMIITYNHKDCDINNETSTRQPYHRT